jgi:hypothetical protein
MPEKYIRMGQIKSFMCPEKAEPIQEIILN